MPVTVGELTVTNYGYNQQLLVLVVSFIDLSTPFINPSKLNLYT